MRIFPVLLLLFLPSMLFGGEYYASTSSSGSANGSSWANAWALSSVPWASLQSGSTDHTLYIDGGASGLSYAGVSIQHNSSSNRLYIKPGSASPFPSSHDGLVTFTSQIVLANTDDAIYITIDGKKSESDSSRNIKITSTVNGIYFPYNDINAYVIIRYIEFYQNGSNDTQSFAGVWMADSTPNGQITIEYCYFNHMRQKGIRGVGSKGTTASSTIIRHNTFIGGCDDDVATANYTTLDNNVFDGSDQGTCPDAGAHQDGLQADTVNVMGWVIINNEYRDHTQELFFEADGTSGASSIRDIWIYNNIFDDRDGLVTSPGIMLGCKGSYACTIDNVIVSNNTFVGTSMASVRLASDAGATSTVTNSRFINNIIIDGADSIDISGPFVWNDSGFSFDYNILNNPKALVWLYGGSTIRAYTGTDSAQWAADHPTFTHNKVSAPSLVNKAGYDYHLQAVDTVAKDSGTNLSAYFTTDKDGNTRSGTWDIGAYEWTGSSSPTTPPIIKGATIRNGVRLR